MNRLAYSALAVLMTTAVAASASLPDSAASTSGFASRDTPAQRTAARRAYLDQEHPKWRTLSAAGVLQQLAKSGRRMILHAVSPATSTPVPAAFQGNQTFIQSPSGQSVSLQRQADCSLTYRISGYTLSLTAPTFQTQSTIPNYQDVLHAAAGLTTRADANPHGCADPTVGIGSRRAAYLGKTSQNLLMFASTGYNYVAGSDTLFYTTVDATSLTVHSFNGDLSVASIAGMTAGDLNGDGLADPIVLDAQSGSVTVWLAHADGTLGAPTRYATTGTKTLAAVVADVNGDGKLDLVVAGSSVDANAVEQQSIAVLLGRGDGTFQPAQTFAVSAPPSGNTPLATLAAADLRGSGHLDIVGSNGLVLLNNGTGGFTQSSTWAFPSLIATSSFGPSIAVGDFDEDGKLDVAVDDGAAIRLYLGRGDGTFVPGRVYASSGDNVGYVSAVDLDGDGHLDLYVGLANGGIFVGDQFTYDTGYALMGHGDGSFSGAPVLPFVDNGHSMIDLDRDGNADAVAMNDDLSFTTYLGDGQGGFVAKATLSVATLTLGGNPFPLNGIDSYDLGDVNGDGNADLVFLGSDFMARNDANAFLTPGFLIALGDGHGGLAQPTFLPAPTFVPANDIDVNLQLSNVRLADVNGDGKADLVYTYADTSYLTHQRTVGVAVQLGNGNGTFQAPDVLQFFSVADTGFFNQTSNVIRFADVNGDGKLDLVLVTQTATLDPQVGGYRSNIQVALGHGDGTFATPVSVPGPDVFAYANGESVPVTIADMNGDGVPDMVILGGSSTYSAQVAIALGNGDGTFKPPSRTTLSAQYLNNGQQLAAADFDGDGKADVLFANPYGISGIVNGNGDGTLAPLGTTDAYLPNLTIGVPLSGATRVVDFSHDAKPDVIVGDVLLLSATTATASAADFSLTAHSVAGTVHAGQSVQDALTLAPTGGFTGTASFACSGLPSGASCSFAPTSVALGSGNASTTMTIATAGAASGVIIGSIDPRMPMTLFLGIGATFAMRRRSKERSHKRLGSIALVALTVMALGGCHNDSSNGSTGSTGSSTSTSSTPSTPTGTYTVVVTATSGAVSHTINYVLTVD